MDKSLSTSIYDWLEKPIVRSPVTQRPRQGQYNCDEELNLVSETMNIYDAPPMATMDPSLPYNTEADYTIKIEPMLFPQVIQPEFFMNNFAKAKLAQLGINKISFENFKKRSGLDYNQLAWLLCVARNTLINKKGADVFDTSISEKLLSLAEIYTHGFDVFGSEEVFIKWLNSPNRALGNVTPFSLLQTQYGRQEVQNILGRIEWGVYS